jgi:hypothetical protein
MASPFGCKGARKGLVVMVRASLPGGKRGCGSFFACGHLTALAHYRYNL